MDGVDKTLREGEVDLGSKLDARSEAYVIALGAGQGEKLATKRAVEPLA